METGESPPMTSWVLVRSARPGCTRALVLEGQPSGPGNLVSTQLGGMGCCVCRWGLAPKSSAWLRAPGAAWRLGQAQAPPDCVFWPGGGCQPASGPSVPDQTCQAGLGVSQSGWPPEDWQAWLLGCPLPLHPPTEPRGLRGPTGWGPSLWKRMLTRMVWLQEGTAASLPVEEGKTEEPPSRVRTRGPGSLPAAAGGPSARPS